jgi:hypothetical protein
MAQALMCCNTRCTQQVAAQMVAKQCGTDGGRAVKARFSPVALEEKRCNLGGRVFHRATLDEHLEPFLRLDVEFFLCCAHLGLGLVCLGFLIPAVIRETVNMSANSRSPKYKAVCEVFGRSEGVRVEMARRGVSVSETCERVHLTQNCRRAR